MYSVVLSYERRPDLRFIERAHRFVLGTNLSALSGIGPDFGQQGTSDLTIGPRKFSGNSLRCRRTHLLYHGTLLYDFQRGLIGELLRTPPRQPDYRGGRSHGQFVCNAPVTVDHLRRLLVSVWQAHETWERWPREASAELAAAKYSSDAWNLRL